MSEWQPIETAPKDGTSILLWCPSLEGMKMNIAHYEDVDHSGVLGKFVWATDNDGGAIAEQCVTHWIPLPEPPK